MPRGSCRACLPLAVRPLLLRQALFPLASSVAGKPDDPGHNGPNALLSGKGMPSLPFHDARPQILDHSTGGYLLRPFPISTGGRATIPVQMGHLLQESVTEATSARSPSLSDDALGRFFNEPHPPCPRPRMRSDGSSSARVDRTAGHHQRTASLSFENGSAGKAKSMRRAWKSGRA